MKKLASAVTLMFFCGAGFAGQFHSVTGYWKTIDDETGKAKSILSISENADHQLVAKVERLISQPDKRCIACKGEKHNQPIKGMQVMWGLVQDAKNHDVWSGGSILDPKSGKIYHCNLKLSENGRQLKVRGYIGVPLFGRSQVWERVKS